jgi:hypothetical protein
MSRPIRLILCGIATGLFLAVAATVQAWAPEGHEIIAIVAEQRLEPTTRKAVEALLQGASFVKAANWADQVRNKQTAPWHYVNIELSETQYEPAKHCPNNQCVIGQIQRFRKTLADPSVPHAKRRKALKYLIHFIGDLHQPLHAGENHDRGGNDVPVQFMGQMMNPFSKKPWNLHAVWDSGILEQSDPDPHHVAVTLNIWLESRSEKAFLTGSVADWAMQAHDIARDHAYDLPVDRKLDEDYVTRNLPLVSEQLARAGARLAYILNQALGTRHAEWHDGKAEDQKPLDVPPVRRGLHSRTNDELDNR